MVSTPAAAQKERSRPSALISAQTVNDLQHQVEQADELVRSACAGPPMRCSPSTTWRSVEDQRLSLTTAWASCLCIHDPQQKAAGRISNPPAPMNLHQHDEIARESLLTKPAVMRKAASIQKAVDQPFHRGRAKAERNAAVVPVGQQVAANQLTGAQRQHFIGEQADIDGLHGAPQPQPHHRGQQRIPAPAMADVHGKIEDHRQQDPAKVQRGNGADRSRSG
jgi:hypothetical protein